jgi:SUKH-4 immunity protein
MTDPCKFAREWDGDLRPIEFPVPRPMLPSSTVKFLHYAGLPKRFHVETDQIIHFDFLSTAGNLSSAWPEQMRELSIPVGWARFWRIGDITYTQASAWLCIEELTGRIVGIDVDIDDPVYLVNSSVAGMMQCMKLLRDWARSTGGVLTGGESFSARLAREPGFDPADAKHFWLPLVEAAIDSGCESLEIRCE